MCLDFGLSHRLNFSPPCIANYRSQDRIGKGSAIGTLILFGMVLVAITHRPDPDDAQYLNFVVTAMDFPFESLFSHSGLWQDSNVPLESPIYRFHTYELLVAVLSDAFSVNHKTVYYLILAPIFGGIAILVHWRLAQYLAPQYAFSVLLAWLVLVLVLGDSHREFGNFAFVRLYQGKGLLVTIGLPLMSSVRFTIRRIAQWASRAAAWHGNYC